MEHVLKQLRQLHSPKQPTWSNRALQIFYGTVIAATTTMTAGNFNRDEGGPGMGCVSVRKDDAVATGSSDGDNDEIV